MAEQRDLFGLMDEIQALENQVAHLQRRVAELEAQVSCSCVNCTRHRPGRSFQEWERDQ